VLDVHRKFANLGRKRYRWSRARKSMKPNSLHFEFRGSQLLQILRVARQQETVDLISSAHEYDRLGINDALLHSNRI